MARILLISYSGYGAWFTLRFQREGHSVDYYLKTPELSCVLEGIVKPPLLEEPKDYSVYDLVIFDLTGRPRLAEKIRKVTPVLGDGELQSQLEEDRLFGIKIMEECDINVPFYKEFTDYDAASAFIRQTKKRYVFKPDGGQEQETATTYVSKDADDLLEYLGKLGKMSKGAKFILQEVVKGTEISTEAYFNGEEFFLINATLEEKKFMNDNKGPNTGCAGNLVWIYHEEPKIFKDGLKKLKPFLQSVGFVGMVDLNTIVSDTEVFGLEWTPRFGYDASATLFSLVTSDLGEFLCELCHGGRPMIERHGPKFAAAVRLSIPPYPSEIHGRHPEGIPIKGIEEEDVPSCFLYDAKVGEDGTLVTAGTSGFIAVPICRGASLEMAFENVYERIDKIQIPDMQYRTDLAESIAKRYYTLLRQGWIT